MRELFWGSKHPKKLTDMDASIMLGVYTPKIIDGYGCVNHFGDLHPQNN